MILNRGLLIAGAIPLPWNNYSNRSFQRWLKCSHLAVFLGLPVSAYGLGPAVNRKLFVCLHPQLPKIFEETYEGGVLAALWHHHVMEVMMLSDILLNQSDIYHLGMEFNVICERTKYCCTMPLGDADNECTRILLIGLLWQNVAAKQPTVSVWLLHRNSSPQVL